jgi:hypothetical protein
MRLKQACRVPKKKAPAAGAVESSLAKPQYINAADAVG